MENERVWKSYVWHDDKCFFISTINRDYDTYEGVMRGGETLVWEYDWETDKRGAMIYQAGGVLDHQAICRCLINDGTILDQDDEGFLKFR